MCSAEKFVVKKNSSPQNHFGKKPPTSFSCKTLASIGQTIGKAAAVH